MLRIKQGRLEPFPPVLTGIGLLLFCGIAILPPVLMLAGSLVQEGQFTFNHYSEVFGEMRTLTLFVRTISIAIGATLIALVLGVPFSLFVSRINFRGRVFCRLLYLIPLFIPPHVHALAWMTLCGEKGYITSAVSKFLPGFSASSLLYSVFGAAFVLALSYVPLVILPLTTGLKAVQRSQEEAALLARSTISVFSRITLPLLKPYLISGCIFVFIFSFFNYGVSSMLRVTTFPVEILARFSAFYDEAGAAALCLPVVLVAVGLLLWQQKVLLGREFIGTTIMRSSMTYHCENTHSSLAGLYCWSVLFVSVFLPVTALIILAGNWINYTTAFTTSWKELLTSLLIGSLAATVTTMLAYLVARHEQSTMHKYTTGLLSSLPFAFPAVLFGIGLIYLWNHPWSQLIYSSFMILILAYMGRFIPFAIRILASGLQQIHPHQLEAAFFSEPSQFKRFWYIEFPQMKHALIACWAIVFIFCMGELGATLLVIPAGLSTASLKIYTLMHYGAGSLVAALSLILVIITLAVSALILLPTQRGNQ